MKSIFDKDKKVKIKKELIIELIKSIICLIIASISFFWLYKIDHASLIIPMVLFAWANNIQQNISKEK